MNTLLDHKQMSHNLKQSMMEYMQDNVHHMSYQTLAELAVIFATKFDQHYKKLFFERSFKQKFIKELKYLDQETFYKILWSLVKAKAIAIDEQAGAEWFQVKEAIVAKVKDFDPKTLTNILVLATVAKGSLGVEGEEDSTAGGGALYGDLWEQVEPEVIIKMKTMQLADLLNLLWAAKELKRGGQFFYQKLEEELLSRIRTVKDDDLQLLIECFSSDS